MQDLLFSMLIINNYFEALPGGLCLFICILVTYSPFLTVR